MSEWLAVGFHNPEPRDYSPAPSILFLVFAI